MIRLACATLLTALATVTLSTAATADPGGTADLSVEAAFDKTAYTTDDTYRLDITVHNAGPDPATKVVFGMPSGNARFDPPGWGDFDLSDKGVRIEPGQSVALSLTGRPNQFQLQDGAIRIGLTVIDFVAGGTADPDATNNQLSLEIPLTQAFGDYTGTIYADRNGDGVMNSGEALSGVTVALTGGLPYAGHSATTDSDGHFAFRRIPVGEYTRSIQLPPGWSIPVAGILIIDSKEHGDVLLKATPNLGTVLTASVTFTKETYSAGDQAHLTVVLTNSGSLDITEITALCTGAGFGFEIDSAAPGWGDLAYQGPGVTVAAHETRTLDVWSTVPDGAFTWGFVGAACLFSTPSQVGNEVMAQDRARVPGGIGSVGGQLIYDRNGDGTFDGDGVPGTKVVLLDEETTTVTARAITDANGHFSFRDVPAFGYKVVVVGPWKIVDGADFSLQVLAGGNQQDKAEILVIPGANQPDPDTPPTSTPQADTPPSATTLQLATTGTDVDTLILLGSILIILGVQTIRRSRPRPR